MRNSIKCCGGRETGVSDADAEVLVKYLTALWGPNSILPASPASDPRYKATVRPIVDEALNIVYVEYDLPGPHRMPWSAVPDGKGNVWLPYKSSASSIARVNIETGEVKEYRVPYKGIAQIHTVYPAPDGTVWAGETGGANALVRWDPKTEQMEEFPDVSGKHTVRVRQDGMVCVTGRITLFDPKTKEYTHFDERAFAYGTMFDKEGNCWFTEYDKTGKLGKIDLKTKQLKTWIPPTAKNGKQVYSRRIDMDHNGVFWIAQSEAGQIASFDPKTETFKEFPLPGPAPTPYAMNLDKDEYVWYSSEYTDMFGRLDPKTGKTVEYPFPHAEAFSREFFLDAQGRNWYATPSNNRVGYFYLAK
jgi:virginiamycin B lyase